MAKRIKSKRIEARPSFSKAFSITVPEIRYRIPALFSDLSFGDRAEQSTSLRAFVMELDRNGYEDICDAIDELVRDIKWKVYDYKFNNGKKD